MQIRAHKHPRSRCRQSRGPRCRLQAIHGHNQLRAHPPGPPGRYLKVSLSAGGGENPPFHAVHRQPRHRPCQVLSENSSQGTRHHRPGLEGPVRHRSQHRNTLATIRTVACRVPANGPGSMITAAPYVPAAMPVPATASSRTVLLFNPLFGSKRSRPAPSALTGS